MKKAEPKKEVKKEAPKKEEAKKEAPKKEVVKDEVCPHEACHELKEAWKKGVRGCFTVNSRWCGICGKDYPKIAKMCKENTGKEVAKKEAIRTEKKQKSTVMRKKGAVDNLGSGALTQAGQINAALQSEKGLDVKRLAAMWVKNGESDDQVKSERRIHSHIAFLKKRGAKIVLKDGLYKKA
jgi:hypothetical protein